MYIAVYILYLLAHAKVLLYSDTLHEGSNMYVRLLVYPKTGGVIRETGRGDGLCHSSPSKLT